MKKLKINYLFIGILALLLVVALWPSIPWFGKADNCIAVIQAWGELCVSTIHTPLTYNEINGKPFGLDYELVKQFADYLGVKLKVTVWQNISQLFDDLDNGNADLLVAGLVYNSEWVKNYQPGPTYYSVSQQLVYKVGQYCPCMLGNLMVEQLTVALGHVVVNDLQTLKETKFLELSWKVDDKKGSVELMEDVIEGKLDYTIADSVAISLFQRVHLELAVVLDITDEQLVTWFSLLDGDNTLSAALLDFFNEMNEDGMLACIEEKYLGHGDDFDYVDMCTFLCAVDVVLLQLKPLFEKYAEEIDWCLLAAIAYQELHWDAQATSLMGVRGMMMLTKNTVQSLGIMDCTDAEQSISGGVCYLQDMMSKVLESVLENEWIWFALAVYNMGYVHMLDACALMAKTKGNPDSWADVKQCLPLLSQKPYYSKLTYGYACGHEAYAYVENICKYQISLVGYLQEKEKQATEVVMQLAQDYLVVLPMELGKEKFPFLLFLSQLSSNYLTHSLVMLPTY